MRRPALPLAVALLLGIALAPIAAAPPVLAAPVAGLSLLGSLLACRRERSGLATLFVLSAYLLAGLALGEARRRESSRRTLRQTYRSLGEKAFVQPSRIAGRLRREVELSPEYAVLTLDTSSVKVRGVPVPASGGLRATVGGELSDALRGRVAGEDVLLWARLGEPSSFANPGGFDQEGYLQRERVDLVASVKSALLVETGREPSFLASFLSRARLQAVARLESCFDEPSERTTLAVAVALVTGDRARLTPETEELFRRAGVFHVLAISGAHVGIVAFALYWLLRRSGLSEVGTLWVLVLLLPLYAGFCGGRPPVVRAVLVALAVAGARLLSLEGSGLNSLALAAMLLLAWEPAWLSDPGFQLSFAAMAGILWLAPTLAPRLALPALVARPLAVSLAAQAAVVPVALWHFRMLTPVAPLASLIAIPLAGLALILALVLIACAGIPLASDVVSAATHFSVRLLVESSRWAGEMPLASLFVPRPSIPWILLYLAAVVAVRSGIRPLRVAGLSGAALLLLWAPFAGSIPRGRFELTALDVGHGDALVLVLPEGRRVLVDGGGAPGSSFDVGQRVVLPYLLDSGGRKLDAILVSHADFDHLGGLPSIVDAMAVGAIWEGASSWDRPAYRLLRERARRAGVPVRRLRAGETFAWGGARWEVLAAGGASLEPPPDSENERSVVLRVSHGRSRVLLTGDAGRILEEQLLRARAPLRSDLLKVGHHGSRGSTSPAFLEAVRPRLALLSARRTAGRPLPSTRILTRFRERGIDYLRTDESGAITVRLEESGAMSISTHRSGGSSSWPVPR